MTRNRSSELRSIFSRFKEILKSSNRSTGGTNAVTVSADVWGLIVAALQFDDLKRFSLCSQECRALAVSLMSDHTARATS